MFEADRGLDGGGCPIRSDIPTMLSHLRKCKNQPEDVKSWAEGEYTKNYSRSRASIPPHSFAVPSVPIPYASSSHHPIQNLPPISLEHFPPSPLGFQPELTPQLSPLVVNAPIPQSYSPYVNALGFSAQPSPNLSPHLPLSRPPSSSSFYPHGSTVSRPPSSSSSHSHYSALPQPLPRSASSGFNQRTFDMCVGRMTVAAGLPMSWTDNPEVRSVFRTFFPWVQLPSRKTLSRSILPTLQSSLRTQAQKEARGSNCTLQCDGWTGINSHHLIAFMITVWPKVCV